MSQEAVHKIAVTGAPPRSSGIRRFFSVFFGRGVVVIGMLIILLFIITSLFAPWLAPYKPDGN